MVLAAVLLALLAAMTALVTLGRRPAVVGALFACCAVAWLLGNKALEGPVLWSLDRHHGLTVGDLAVLPGLVAAAAAVWRERAERTS